MLLLSHIIVALASLFYSTYLFAKPSRGKFYVSYSLVAGTLASGTVLVLSSHANLVQACTTGLIYLAMVSACILAAHHKLVNADK